MAVGKNGRECRRIYWSVPYLMGAAFWGETLQQRLLKEEKVSFLLLFFKKVTWRKTAFLPKGQQIRAGNVEKNISALPG